MRKRLISALLAAAIVLICVPSALGEGSVSFVGINDSVPMYLSGGEAPYYKGNLLYVPYTVFQAGPGGIAVSYNIDKGSLVLFTRAKRLVYDLNAETVTDELQKVSNISVVYRNGILYIPVSKAATHFGLTATMLTSSSGCPVLRFTDGSQKLDNPTFIRKAETLISMILEREEDGGNTSTSQPGTEGERKPGIDAGPATVYLAFAGDTVSRQTLETLKTMRVSSAFFLTQEQIEQDPDLVREIYAQGHHIGVTVADVNDYESSLRLANDALDRVLFAKSVTVLLPSYITAVDGYIVFQEKPMGGGIDDVLNDADHAQLFVCRTNADLALQRLLQEGAYTPKLRETTYLP